MSLIIPQMTCDFYSVQTVLFVSQYWLPAFPPKFIVYPGCKQCSYLVNYKTLWTTSLEPLKQKYEVMSKNLFSFTGSTLTQDSSIPVPGGGKQLIPITMEMTGNQNFKFLGRNKDDLGNRRIHSYTVGIKDSMGLVWCLNHTIHSQITRPASSYKVPLPPSSCVTDLNRFRVRDGNLDIPLRNIPVKVGSAATIALMISTRSIDVQCTFLLRSDHLTQKEIAPTSCAFGLMTVSLSISTDVKHSVDENGVAYMTVGGVLHYTGIFQSYLVNYLYVRVSNIGGTLPENEACKKIESLAFTSTSIGDKSNINIEDMPIIVKDSKANCTLSLDKVSRSRPAQTRDPVFLLYMPSATKIPFCKCEAAHRHRRELKLQPLLCPHCSWSADMRSLTLEFHTLAEPKFLPKDVYLYLLDGSQNRAWHALFQTEDQAGPTGKEPTHKSSGTAPRGGLGPLGSLRESPSTDSHNSPDLGTSHTGADNSSSVPGTPNSEPSSEETGPSGTIHIEGPTVDLPSSGINGDSPSSTPKPELPAEVPATNGVVSSNEGISDAIDPTPANTDTHEPSPGNTLSDSVDQGGSVETTHKPVDGEGVEKNTTSETGEENPSSTPKAPSHTDSETPSTTEQPQNLPPTQETPGTSDLEGSGSTEDQDSNQTFPPTSTVDTSATETDPQTNGTVSSEMVPAAEHPNTPKPEEGGTSAGTPHVRPPVLNSTPPPDQPPSLSTLANETIPKDEDQTPKYPETQTPTVTEESTTASPQTDPQPPTPTPSQEETSLTTSTAATPNPEIRPITGGKYWMVPLYAMLTLLGLIFIANVVVCIMTNSHPDKYIRS